MFGPSVPAAGPSALYHLWPWLTESLISILSTASGCTISCWYDCTWYCLKNGTVLLEKLAPWQTVLSTGNIKIFFYNKVRIALGDQAGFGDNSQSTESFTKFYFQRNSTHSLCSSYTSTAIQQLCQKPKACLLIIDDIIWIKLHRF